jgi:DNA-binding NtrC family response regulator
MTTTTLSLQELASRLPASARRLTLDELRTFVEAPALSADAIAAAILALPTATSKLREVERALVRHALDTSGGNQSAAARLIGMDRKKFTRMVARCLER